MPDDPVITMWVNVYDDHIEPILDGYDWVPVSYTHLDVYKRQPLEVHSRRISA